MSTTDLMVLIALGWNGRRERGGEEEGALPVVIPVGGGQLGALLGQVVG